MNNQRPSTSQDDNFLNPNQQSQRNQTEFYRNQRHFSTGSLKSTFSDTNREPIDYNKLQDRYATHDKVKRPGTVDRIVSKVRSSLICCPNDEAVKNHRKNASVIEVNINESRSEVTLSKTNKEDEVQSSKYGCNSTKTLNTITSLFPIIDSLKNYDLKNDFLKDLFAGITIAVLHIPQGMAYGILAGVGAVNGLYVSFFPVLIYGLLGTSRHVSIGTFAVVSIMLYNTANKMGAFNRIGDDDSLVTTTALPFNNTVASSSSFFLSSNTPADATLPPTPIEVLTSLSLLIGVLMILMGTLNLGILSLILSDQLITSFSSGAAIHVATSQVGYIFGWTTPRYNGHLKLVYIWIDLIKQYNHISYPTLIISVSVLLTLIIFKEFLELPLRRKLRIDFQIPIDLFVIIVATFVGSQLNWGKEYEIKIMGPIPVGLPAPKLPRTDFLFEIFYDALAITMVIFALLISLAKLYANKFNYKISPNHELIALGSANLIGSFFLCFPSSASLSRSSVQERTGAKTQLVGIISSLIVLTILLYLAPLFYYLPKCVLACIIFVALKGLFLQIGELGRTWKTSRSEGLVWLVTFTSTVLLDVDLGLVIGIIFSLIMTLLQFTMPTSTILQQVPFTEIYVDKELYSKTIQLKGIRIFQYSCPLFFLNCDYFKEQLFIKTLHMPFGEILARAGNVSNDESQSPTLSRESKGKQTVSSTADQMNVNLAGMCDDVPANTNYGYVDDNQQTITSGNNQHILKAINSQFLTHRPSIILTNEDTITSDDAIQINPSAFTRSPSKNHIFECIYEADNDDEQTVHTIIIDCSGISTVDSAGVRCLEEVIKDFQKISLHCYLANCPSPLLLMFKRMKFIDRLPANAGIYATIHDAVLNAFRRTNQFPDFNGQDGVSLRSAPVFSREMKDDQPPNTFTVKKKSSLDLLKKATDSKEDRPDK